MCSIFIFIVAFSILNLSVSVYANQPIVRFKNRTVGILADADAGVFTATENVTILGDLEVKATNKTANIIEEVDSLIRLRNDVELRIKYFSQHEGMGVVCNPEGTEYRARDFGAGTFGACVCKKGYTGISCEPVYIYTYTFEINENVAASHMEITKILIDGEFPETDLVTVLLEQNSIRDGTDKTVMLDDISTSYLHWKSHHLVTGTQVLEIKTRKVMNEFEISYWRPRYAPGWRILLDGEEVVKETENRGSDAWPSPATFTYDVLPPSY